jgi:hypothetical protein
MGMQGRNIIRAFFFCVFFGIGATVISGSILCDVLLTFYHNKQLLHNQQQRTNHLKSLIADYNALLEEIERDPNFARRIAPATLGAEFDDADTIYPKATNDLQTAARKALAKEHNQQLAEPNTPAWLTRCGEPHRRIILFFAGAGLILISFICFGPVEQKKR